MVHTPEFLLLALDAGPSLSSQSFVSARNLAFTLAQARVIYGETRADRVGLLVAGSSRTRNPLAEENPGGYVHIEVACHASPLSIDVLRAVRNVTHGRAQTEEESADKLLVDGNNAQPYFNMLDLLEVAGDYVSTRAPKSATRVLRRRVVVISDAKAKMGESYEESLEEMRVNAMAYAREGIVVDVLLVNGLGPEDIGEDDSGVLWEEDEVRKEEMEEEAETDENQAANAEQLDATQRVKRYFASTVLKNEYKRRYERYSAAAAQAASVARQDQIGETLGHVPGEAHIRQEALLWALARTSRGNVVSLAEAERLLERPKGRSKKAVSKFRGVLDIAGVVKIPVKAFTRVLEVHHESATRVSWETTKSYGRNVPVASNTRLVPEGMLAEPNVDIDPSEIIDAYAYGPNYIPEPSDVELYPWEAACPVGLRILCAVSQERIGCVPTRNNKQQALFKGENGPWLTDAFVGNVDVVVAMGGPTDCEPQNAMRALVVALDRKQLGLVARYVARNNGKPRLVYLWPKIERQRSINQDDGMIPVQNETGCSVKDEDVESSSVCIGEKEEETDENVNIPERSVDAWYLYMIGIPTREDIMKHPFASFAPTLETVSNEAEAAMDAFITSRHLDVNVPKEACTRVNIGECVAAVQRGSDTGNAQNDVDSWGDDDNESSDEPTFDPTEESNPALHYFYTAVVQRCLDGSNATELPPISRWARSLLDPACHIRCRNKPLAEQSIKDVVHLFPVAIVERVHRKSRIHVRVCGEERSIAHLLPRNSLEALNNEAAGDNDVGYTDDVAGEVYDGVNEYAWKTPEPYDTGLQLHLRQSSASLDVLDPLLWGAPSRYRDNAHISASGMRSTSSRLALGTLPVLTDASALSAFQDDVVTGFHQHIVSGHTHMAFDLMRTGVRREIRARNFQVAVRALCAVRDACMTLGRADEYHVIVLGIANAATGHSGSVVSEVAGGVAAFEEFVHFVHAGGARLWEKCFTLLTPAAEKNVVLMDPSVEHMREVLEVLERVAKTATRKEARCNKSASAYSS